MPIKGSIGYGSSTRAKHRAMSDWGRLHQRITASVLAKNHHWMGSRYHLIDTTAGNGMMAESDEPSYDLKLVHAATERFGRDLVVHLIERDPENAKRLTERVSHYPAARVHADDHRVVLGAIGNGIGRKCCGLLLYDPNPGRENIDSIPSIAKFSRTHQQIDIMVFLGGTPFKRMKDNRSPTMVTMLDQLEKQHWLLSRVFGANQYVVALGTNWSKMPDWKNAGFVDRRSDEGQERVELLTATVAERKKKQQLLLPHTEPMPSISDIPPSEPSEPLSSPAQEDAASIARRVR